MTTPARSLHTELTELAAAARAHGMTVIDLATIEQILKAHSRPPMAVFPLVD